MREKKPLTMKDALKDQAGAMDGIDMKDDPVAADSNVSEKAEPAKKAKRGRPKKDTAAQQTTVAPQPAVHKEEQLDEEAEEAAKPAAVSPIVQREEAVRKHLQGEGYTKEDFAKSRNYLVEAGAGAGKTYIMVRRIVNQLISGYCEPEDLVAITFTNKSTLELRERLDKFLKERKAPLQKKAESSVLTEEETRLLERLDYLIRESGRMQVSTIHSFCQTMLESMPFASPFGLDMQVVDSDEPLAKKFLKRKWREAKRPFAIPRELGVKTSVLEELFLECCKNSETAIGYTDVNSPEAIQWKQDVKNAVHHLQRELHHSGVTAVEIRKDVRDVIAMDPADFDKDRYAIRKLIWEILNHSEQIPLDWSISIEDKEAFWTSADGETVNGIWRGQWGKLLRESGQYLIHSYAMRDVEELLEAFRQEKRERHIATYDDLLLRTRDMLRDEKEARTYFHQRYKVLYVDEMQDTDPVQTEMLFYLTTNEKDFDPTNWKRCKPVPGSLFLVGDPKQAIYRFRGADISVYNDLLDVFQSSEDIEKSGMRSDAVGEKVTLRFNFRSAAEICELADKVFAPEDSDQDPKPHKFVGGNYHAEYVSMIAKNGTSPRARIVRYEPASTGKTTDPKRVAAFIYKMIEGKRYVGIHQPDRDDKTKGRLAHEAQPEDFLILTKRKKDAQKYADALRVLGIPAEVSGERSFSGTDPIVRSVLHLHSLLALRDDQKLLLVLRTCYDIKDEQIRVFLQRTGESSLTGVVKRAKLEKIQRALTKEPQPNPSLLALCSALEEIAELREMARKQPAMAVIERLLESGYGVWKGIEKKNQLQRRQIYSEVQQYLNLVRGSRERSFPALATYAIECVEKTFEHELGLEPSGKAVRIMNLHKAKGLEGEVVILACDWQTEFPVTRHVERSSKKATEYRVIRYGLSQYHQATIGCPKDWAMQEATEQCHLEAEYARLLYVAATRAQTMLVVCDKNEKSVSQTDKTPYWAPLLEGLPLADESDPYYGEAFKALNRLPKIKAESVGDAAQASAVVQPSALEGKLREESGKLAKSDFYAITPSRLNKNTRSVIQRKDEEDPAVAEPVVTADSVAADLDDGDEQPAATLQDSSSAPVPDEETPGPYGADWGTIVHRLMELVVRSGDYSDENRHNAARQAVTEHLTENLVLTDRQRRMLRLEDSLSAKEITDRLAEQAAEAAVFLAEETSALRTLLENAEAYPELPFFLQAGKDEVRFKELYRHLSDHIGSDTTAGRTLAVEGIIDLAIHKNGHWYVVDYKTDKLTAKETKEQFVQRLREEYTPQITAYARVLDQMGMGKTERAWLCSIPLRGELIELDVSAK